MTWDQWLLAAVDVVAVYYIVLRLLRVVRGTRTGAVMIGLCLVFVVWVGAGQAGLTALDSLLGKFFDSLVIIIVVVFQADIRRALARVGGGAKRWGRAHQSDDIVPEIAAAAGRLAEQKVGAMIVVERGADLSDRLEGAARLDAAVTRGLLISLFNPDSPMHDGAVVIREGRVAVAGYYMPLAMDSSLPDDLGTRHRAAVGLTEDVDAAVVVVSEERGEISVALDGLIERGLSQRELADRLRTLLGREELSGWGATLRGVWRAKDEA
jgi:diadenylate cyclase